MNMQALMVHVDVQAPKLFVTKERTKMQAIFDKVATHMLLQGEPALGRGIKADSCMYRGTKKMQSGTIFKPCDVVTKCAVGCLIPDELYHTGLEGLTVDQESQKEKNQLYVSPLLNVLEKVGIPRSAAPLLSMLQKVHDKVPEGKWSGELKEVADRCGLSREVIGAWEVDPIGFREYHATAGN